MHMKYDAIQKINWQHGYMKMVIYIYIYNIYIYIQWCEKVLAPFLIFYFLLAHFNVSDHQTNLNINQR